MGPPIFFYIQKASFHLLSINALMINPKPTDTVPNINIKSIKLVLVNQIVIFINIDNNIPITPNTIKI